MLKLDDVNVPKCICCKEPVTWSNMGTADDWLEFEISKTCGVCFDNILVSELQNGDVEDFFVVENLNFLFKNPDVMVGGGVFRHLVDPTDKICDIDVFFKSLNKLQDTKDVLTNEGFVEVFACPKGELFTYKNEDGFKIQLITKFIYPDIDTLIGSFDITACCAAYDGKNFVAHQRFVFDVLNKRINLNAITYPVATLNRITKYVQKGYALTPDANLKFIEYVNSVVLDEDNMVYYVD